MGRARRRLGPGATALGLALAVARCAHAPAATPAAPVRPLRTATLDEVVAAYDGYCRGIETLSASGDLEVRDLRRGKTRRLSMRLLAGRGGRLYVKGSVAIVTALEVVADGSRFWFLLPSKKTVWTGGAAALPDAEADDEAPYRALRPADVTSALLPEPLDAGEGDALLLDADRESFALSLGRSEQGRGTLRRRIVLERESLRPVRMRSYGDEGELRSEVRLSAWTDGTPRQVDVARPLEGYEASLRLDRVQRNRTLPDKAFAPRTPAGYRVVEVH
jgi:hypothetical protein